MMRLGRGVLAAAAVAGLLWPATFPSDGGGASATPDPATINDLRVAMTVDRDGTLHAAEVVTTEMPEGRHGIFRFWDVADAGDPHARVVPHDVKVTQDGVPATVDLSWQDWRRYRVAKIGDAGRYLTPGTHTYRISYLVDGVLDGAGGRSRFYWDVVPAGWQMAIRHAEVTLHLPAGTAGGATRCAVGLGATEGCALGGGDGSYRVAVDGLAPDTPVTVEVPVDEPPPARPTLPWTARFDPVLSRHVWFAAALAVLTVAFLFLGLALGWRVRERSPGLPLQYAPPEGVGPVQAAYVVTERVPDAALAATLLYMAQQGLAELDTTEGGRLVVRGKATAKQWYAGTDEVTRAVGKSLGVTGAGESFVADMLLGRGERLLEAKALVGRSATRWATSKGILRPAVAERTGRRLVYAAIVLAGCGFLFNPFDVTAMGAPFAAFALGGFALTGPGVGTRRTARGRELWSRAGGFARTLSTPSAEQRFEFSGREELYTAYIPWAVAFGCAKQWQRKYETETGRAAPVPVWLGSPHLHDGAASVADVIDSFESSLHSSISAYQSAQASSSPGGGGGFSGGGGGGGGGGGSW